MSENRPRPSGRKWPLLVVGLLSLNVCVCALTVAAATRSPAVVEPDYYKKALDWDAHRASLQREEDERE